MLNLDRTTLPPSLLNNRYQVLGVLGDGSFGMTYLVEDTLMPSARKCVVKQLKPVSDNPQVHQMVQERFQREAAVLEKLGENYDQIPRLYANFVEGNHFYLVEEWIDGVTLTQKIQSEGILNEGTVREILCGILPAIAHIHRHQIIHRDLKPDNIILRNSDRKPVLIDFGAVKETMGAIINSQTNSSHSIVVGTPGYMASEQLAGRPVYASDLYSLGMTAIYLLTGRQPQDLDSDPRTGEIHWQHYAPMISPGFAAVLNRSIHINPAARFASAEEMLTAVLALGSSTLPFGHMQPANMIAAAQPLPSIPHTQFNSTSNFSSPHSQMTPTSAPGSEWKKAVITGGIIGISILGGALLLKSQIPGGSTEVKPSASPSPVASASPSPSSSPAPSAASSPKPSPTAAAPAQPTIPALTQVTDTNATIVGEPGAKNIRSGATTSDRVLYRGIPGDRVRIIGTSRNSDGHPWYQVLLPDGGTGWIAGQLVNPDRPIVQAPVSTPVQSQSSDTNATIVGQPGSKNVRSAPGTNNSVAHIAYTGDRVRILDIGNDSGGYVWYKVYFPNSGAIGWIAEQLIQRD